MRPHDAPLHAALTDGVDQIGAIVVVQAAQGGDSCMYLMRLVYHCKRGKTPEVIECLKLLKQVYTKDGCTQSRIYVDRMGRMDRAVYQFEVDSLDAFYTRLRARYASLSPAGQQLVAGLNDFTVEGERELYEVIE